MISTVKAPSAKNKLRKRYGTTWDQEILEAGKRKAALLRVPFPRYAEQLIVDDTLASSTKPTILTIGIGKVMAGKTTVAVYLSVALSRLGKKVLVVDCDKEADATKHFLGERASESGVSILDAFRSVEQGPSVSFEAVIRPTPYENVYVAPMVFPASDSCSFDYAGSELQLCQCLESVQGVYDYVVIDCPATGELIDMAIAAQKAGNPESRFVVPWRETSVHASWISQFEDRMNRTTACLGLPERPVVFLLDSAKIPSFLLDRERYVARMPRPDVHLMGEHRIAEEVVSQWIPIAEETITGLFDRAAAVES